MFSYIMGYFIEKLESFNALHEEENEDEGLNRFLLALQNFNDKNKTDSKFKNKLDIYFNYRWKNDRNTSLRSD